jgi:hypothetical protein
MAPKRPLDYLAQSGHYFRSECGLGLLSFRFEEIFLPHDEMSVILVTSCYQF